MSYLIAIWSKKVCESFRVLIGKKKKGLILGL
jgi:hypothetical protein